jgi:tetraprenyl-beta-curcumene synthase
VRSSSPPLPAALALLVRYEAGVVPVAAKEIARWARHAAAIPDPHLRRLALTTIESEAANAEAAAAFATLAPRARRRTAVELLVAWQLMYDYLDTLGEQPSADPRRDGLHLHGALAVALGAADPAVDFYAHHPRGDDGGYLLALATACRERLEALPSAAVVAPAALAAAGRCAQAQSHVHAALRGGGYDAARAWALQQPGSDAYAWWEILAGGVSDLAVLALLATAADPTATAADAAAVAGAYWPHVCVLSTLLDGVVDAAADVEDSGRSYLADCCGGAVPVERIARAARRSAGATTALRRGGAHAAITAGVAAFYSTVPGARDAHVAATIAPALDALRPAATPLVAALRARPAVRRVAGCVRWNSFVHWMGRAACGSRHLPVKGRR